MSLTSYRAAPPRATNMSLYRLENPARQRRKRLRQCGGAYTLAGNDM